MVKPRKGESKDHYFNRRVPELIAEGKEHSQAVAICNSIYDTKSKDQKFTDLTRYIENN